MKTVRLFGFWDSGLLTRDGLLHLIMPSIALSSIMLPLFIRLIRSEMMEVLGVRICQIRLGQRTSSPAGLVCARF